jgi:hypothetical protein
LYFRLGGSSYRVLSPAEDTSDVLFPLHDYCLAIIQHVLTWRARLSPEGGSPPDLMRVYRAFCAQFSCNVQEKRIIAKERGFYGSTDYMEYGLEFDHGYYGARKFWASEGWEPTKANEVCPREFDSLSTQTSRHQPMLTNSPLDSGTATIRSTLKISQSLSRRCLPRNPWRPDIRKMPGHIPTSRFQT